MAVVVLVIVVVEVTTVLPCYVARTKTSLPSAGREGWYAIEKPNVAP